MTITTNAPQVAAGLRHAAAVLPRAAWVGLRKWSHAQVVPALQREAPARRLQQALFAKAYAHRTLPWVRFWCAADLGLWFERGTGIYGPRRQLITARGGEYTDPFGERRQRSMLRIETPTGVLYRPWSRGMKPRPWFIPTVRHHVRTTLRQTLYAVIRRHLANQLRRINRRTAAGA